MAVDDWVIRNYEEIVADKNRNVSWSQIAQNAEALADAELAAFARGRAAEAGADVTPVDAEPTPEKTVRDEKAKG